MRMNASEVGNWLRRGAGKRDHRQLVPDDQVVLRPGPNFDWLIGAHQPTPTAPEPDPRRQRQARRQPPSAIFTIA